MNEINRTPPPKPDAGRTGSGQDVGRVNSRGLQKPAEAANRGRSFSKVFEALKGALGDPEAG